VEIISDKDLEIYSMISAFENCENLEKIESKGVLTNNVKSLNKLFYNTKIENFNFTEININTNNVEDMSYMFGAINLLTNLINCSFKYINIFIFIYSLI
jgi:hypothetical protein